MNDEIKIDVSLLKILPGTNPGKLNVKFKFSKKGKEGLVRTCKVVIDIPRKGSFEDISNIAKDEAILFLKEIISQN